MSTLMVEGNFTNVFVSVHVHYISRYWKSGGMRNASLGAPLKMTGCPKMKGAVMPFLYPR